MQAEAYMQAVGDSPVRGGIQVLRVFQVPVRVPYNRLQQPLIPFHLGSSLSFSLILLSCNV